jgi:tetratricopeptide (TPR) repeat protein/O-antigen ligase
VLGCLVVFAAPLLVGSVHRPAVLLVPIVAGLGAASLLLGELWRRRFVRVTPAALFLLSLLLIPLLQSVPLPAALARRIDPAGDALLADSPVATARLRPLSLDPPETRAIIAKTGGALAVFLIALHLASGRSQRRLLLVRVVAAGSVVAMAIGLGHRILGEAQIFGHFSPSRGLLNGPFINSNHIAELLELGAFVCVAAALAGDSALNRVGWLAAALMAGACALGSFSRGALLSLAAGTMVFVWLRQAVIPETDETGRSSPRTVVWVTLMVILLAALAIGLGADQVLTRVRDTQLSQELRFTLWKDSLRVLMAHPFGIGRGAFERVFPVYRTVVGTVDVRFSFVESEPLQYLVEMGWVGFLIVVAALAWVVREWARARRRDQIEAALVAALVAVLVHNVVDFGLETLGIQLPFAAILGTLLGRTRDVPERTLSPRLGASVWGIALGAIVIGSASVAHSSASDFDRLVESAPLKTTKREVALRAQAAHPADYFYVLAEAATEPIAPDASGRSPRLHALNHALLLCPHCPAVHSAVAGTLWALGRRRQAADEWHAAIEARPIVFDSVLQGASAAGAGPAELAAIAGADADRLIRSAAFLVSGGHPDAARPLLSLASEAGAPVQQVLLIKAGLDIAAGANEDALKSLAAARKLSPQDPRVYVLLAQANLRAGRVDEALQELDTGIGMNPQDLALLRSRLDLIMGQRRWFLAKNALETLEVGLAEARQPTTEVHLAAARYYSTLRDYGKASSEYNLALTQDPGNAGAWAELGALWEGAGRMAPALEAYRQSNAVSPGNPAILAAIERLSTRIRTIRSGSGLLP